MTIAALELGSLGELITGLATLALAITAAATVIGTKDSFISQARESRGRWLAELHTRFTTEPSFKSVRQQLYNKGQSELNGALVHARTLEASETAQLLSHAEQKLLVQLDDYLDFLALIWSLIDNDQLDKEDAYRLFSWYVLHPFEVDAVAVEIKRNYAPVVKLCAMFREMKAINDAARKACPA